MSDKISDELRAELTSATNMDEERMEAIGVALTTISSLLALLLSGAKFDKKSAAVDISVMQENMAKHFPSLYSRDQED